AFRVTHPVIKMVNVSQNVSVSYHHALGPASRAARVNQSQHCFRVITNLGRTIVSNLQWILIEYSLPGHLHGWSWQRGVKNQPTWSRVGEHPINLRQREDSVVRNPHDSEPATCIPQRYILRTVRQKKGETVSSLKTVCAERGCYAFN